MLLQLYTSLVRPHVEYAASVWDPHLQWNIQLLEKTQRFTCRMCTKTWDVSYEELLSTPNLPILICTHSFQIHFLTGIVYLYL